MKDRQNCHDFALGHLAGAVAALSAVFGQHLEFFGFIGKFFAKIRD